MRVLFTKKQVKDLCSEIATYYLKHEGGDEIALRVDGAVILQEYKGKTKEIEQLSYHSSPNTPRMYDGVETSEYGVVSSVKELEQKSQARLEKAAADFRESESEE